MQGSSEALSSLAVSGKFTLDSSLDRNTVEVGCNDVFAFLETVKRPSLSTPIICHMGDGTSGLGAVLLYSPKIDVDIFRSSLNEKNQDSFVAFHVD